MTVFTSCPALKTFPYPTQYVKNTPWTLNSLLWQVWPLDLPLIS